MTVYPIAYVQAAVERAEALHPDREAAIAAVAQALGLAPEAIREAVESIPA